MCGRPWPGLGWLDHTSPGSTGMDAEACSLYSSLVIGCANSLIILTELIQAAWHVNSKLYRTLTEF